MYRLTCIYDCAKERCIIILSIKKHLLVGSDAWYNYRLHGLPDVTLESTRHEVVFLSLREMTSERQVIVHDPSVMSMVLIVENGIHLLYNKTIVDLCLGIHGVLSNSKLIMLTSSPRLSV